MKPRILQSKADHNAALDRVESLMDAPAGSPEEAELELWTLLIENYESKHAAIPPPDPIEAIRFRMDQLGLNASDLSAYIPSKSKISEVLNHKRPLSLSMIRALHAGLGISADILVQESQASYGKDKEAMMRD
jgi:HTH-type transcriptional regulator/antitoxin HigA